MSGMLARGVFLHRQPKVLHGAIVGLMLILGILGMHLLAGSDDSSHSGIAIAHGDSVPEAATVEVMPLPSPGSNSEPGLPGGEMHESSTPTPLVLAEGGEGHLFMAAMCVMALNFIIFACLLPMRRVSGFLLRIVQKYQGYLPRQPLLPQGMSLIQLSISRT